MQICPVGALTAKPYRFSARPWDLEQVESTCTTCAVGCRVAVQSSGNRLTRVLGRRLRAGQPRLALRQGALHARLDRRQRRSARPAARRHAHHRADGATRTGSSSRRVGRGARRGGPVLRRAGRPPTASARSAARPSPTRARSPGSGSCAACCAPSTSTRSTVTGSTRRSSQALPAPRSMRPRTRRSWSR